MYYEFKLDSRYLNGKIYKMYSKRLPKLLYIGSTIHDLDHRFKQHSHRPTNDIVAKLVQKYDDMTIELIEDYPCLNKMNYVHVNNFTLTHTNSYIAYF